MQIQEQVIFAGAVLGGFGGFITGAALGLKGAVLISMLAAGALIGGIGIPVLLLVGLGIVAGFALIFGKRASSATDNNQLSNEHSPLLQNNQSNEVTRTSSNALIAASLPATMPNQPAAVLSAKTPASTQQQVNVSRSGGWLTRLWSKVSSSGSQSTPATDTAIHSRKLSV